MAMTAHRRMAKIIVNMIIMKYFVIFCIPVLNTYFFPLLKLNKIAMTFT